MTMPYGPNININLTRRFPTFSYALVFADAKLAHFGLREEIARDREIVERPG